MVYLIFLLEMNKDNYGSSVDLQALRTANMAAMVFAALTNLYFMYMHSVTRHKTTKDRKMCAKLQ